MKDYKLTLEYVSPDGRIETHSEAVNSHRDGLIVLDSWLYRNALNNDYRLISVKIKEF